MPCHPRLTLDCLHVRNYIPTIYGILCEIVGFGSLGATPDDTGVCTGVGTVIDVAMGLIRRSCRMQECIVQREISYTNDNEEE